MRALGGKHSGAVLFGMKLISIVALVAILAASLSASTPSSPVDAFIVAELPSSAAPGIAYAQVDGDAVAARGFGERVKGSNTPVDADTAFPIGSVTKSFTALAIMQLVEAGKLGLDDPVSKHLSAFAAGPASEVTVRQLLNHTSGYSTVQGNSHHGAVDAASIGLLDYAAQLAGVEPVHAPGTVWEYSNANYQILGAVIERVSEQSYPDYIEANIFEPLGMTNSSIAVDAQLENVATGHRPWFGGVRAFQGGDTFAINAPAGGIMASANDMGRYLKMWLSGEDDIVSASSKKIMIEPSSDVSPLYGLGWSIDPQRKTVYHTGLVPGGETLASFSPSDRKGVAVMVNANGGLGFADTWYLIGGTGARAMGQSHDDDGSRMGPKIAYLSIALLPPLFVLLIVVGWLSRAKLRAKRGSTAGKFSLWFPVLAMFVLAWVFISILPAMFGGSLATIQLYQPDFAWCLIAAAVLAPLWALLRVVMAYTGGEKAVSAV